MQNILKIIKKNRHAYYQSIMNEIDIYIYREKRYETSFSLAAVCSKEEISLNVEKLQDDIRETDKIIQLSDDLLCIVFDSTCHISYVKTAENLNKALQECYFKDRFFISTATSQEFNKNYLDMTNKLFERLEYAIQNNIFNTVVYEDFII